MNSVLSYRHVLLFGGSGMVGMNLKEQVPSDIVLLAPDKNEVDLNNYNQVVSYIKKHNPELIIHAAGIVGGIQANISNPVKFLVDNMEIGKNVVMAAHFCGVKKILNMGSSCMYPKEAPNPLKEEYILNGALEPTNEGYALAKIMTQRLCSYINKQYQGYSYKTLIPCNLYGRHDKFNPLNSHMIPAVIRKIDEAVKNGNSIVDIWGDGNARREFMYAGDFARIVWEIALRFEEIPEVMNIGLGYDYSIFEYYKEVGRVLGFSGSFKFDTKMPVGMKQKLVDVFYQRMLGLAVRSSLEEGIYETYRFYKEKIRNNE